MNAVRNTFLLKEECEKERMTADEVIFFCYLQKKKKKKSLDKHFYFRFGLMIIDENLELDDSNKEAKEIRDLEKVAEIISWYEDIIKTKNKEIINVAFHQGQIFKRFKEKEKFAKLFSELGIHKTTIIFKINVFKLRKKYPKLLKSFIGLGFFKSYHKDIKAICKET